MHANANERADAEMDDTFLFIWVALSSATAETWEENKTEINIYTRNI